jgi:hypothetical protein
MCIIVTYMDGVNTKLTVVCFPVFKGHFHCHDHDGWKSVMLTIRTELSN